ncbi:Rab family GTPase [Desulfotruncus alcoholivorax]|uniref:Rab family GTPase n=1 Tax=Desulfotruncus alcoholivorax TaxID=265477 RepID=UPI00042239CE|nr:GTP-binding protein [Desulfotruncus alcoholivorax]
MVPVFVQIRDRSMHNLVTKMLKKALNENISVAIYGPVGAGKTTLLRRLVDVLKTKGLQVVQFDLDAVTEDCQAHPDYIIVDHPTSLQSLKKIREEYPGVPLLAVLYEQPERGFDVLVQVWPPAWKDASAS